MEDDHRSCFSRLRKIVSRQSGFMFLIPVSDNLTAEKCTDTFDTHVTSVIGYPYYIVFDRDTLFMSDHFKDWAARKGIKLEPSTAYHPQTDGQSEIGNKTILQAARACKVEGNEWLHKLSEIQLKLNSRDNTARQHSPFFSLLGFEAKLGPSSFPYPITPYTPAEERHLDTSRNLYSSKIKQAKQANKPWNRSRLLDKRKLFQHLQATKILQETQEASHSRNPKSIVQTEQDRVLALSPDDQDLTSAAINLAEEIFNVFLKY